MMMRRVEVAAAAAVGVVVGIEFEILDKGLSLGGQSWNFDHSNWILDYSNLEFGSKCWGLEHMT